MCSKSTRVYLQLTSKYYRKSHASDELNRLFGVLPSNLSVESSFFPFSRGYLLYSAFHSIYLCFIRPSSFFISRNIYSSLFYAILFKKKFIYETHSLEVGWRSIIQSFLLSRKYCVTVVISHALKDLLIRRFSCSSNSIYVLHDAAPNSIAPVPSNHRSAILKKKLSSQSLPVSSHFNVFIGYIGSLHEGRGIEIIIKLASRHPSFCFICIGGPNTSSQKFSRDLSLTNIFFTGHYPHILCQELLPCFDLLLMPYQTVFNWVKGL